MYDEYALKEMSVEEMIEEIASIYGRRSKETVRFCIICENYSHATAVYYYKILLQRD